MTIYLVLLAIHFAVLALPPARLPHWLYVEAPLIHLSVLPQSWELGANETPSEPFFRRPLHYPPAKIEEKHQ